MINLRRFLKNQTGGVTIYAVLTMSLLTGATGFVADYGRMVVLKNQMQNLADSSAMAGAMYLDGSADAINNATAIINGAIQKTTSLSAGDANLTIQSITFYAGNSTTVDPALADSLSVTVVPEDVNFLFFPVTAVVTGQPVATSGTVNANSRAMTSGGACGVPPLMICDFSETMGASADPMSSSNIGKQIKVIKESGINSLAPGNFGILDTAQGSQAAQDIAVAMAAVEPSGCYGSGVGTAPGNKADAIRDGINARFDMPSSPYNFANPAPNVISYGQDTNISSSSLGNASWDFAGYWSANHSGVTAPTSALGTNPTRYQTYLYELGAEFAVNGKETLYPVPDSLPNGYQVVSVNNSPGVPNAEQVCTGHGRNRVCTTAGDGTPNQTPVNDARRRVIQAAVLNCVGDDVHGGNGVYPTHGRYVELFITESVSSDHTIYAEIVGPATAVNSDKVKANVKILQ